ncbi:hypothetical protein ABZU32_04060 [Sphaerisporangium sp. NPDC005288]|uniref:hypothetical protein n=1 Tax=Sphaerisporangium sp. NPDC005288 TaxID=3155114 RepID=UPI0033A274A1
MDDGVLPGHGAEVVTEAGAAEQEQSGALGVDALAGTEQVADLVEPTQVPQAHDVVPFAFADGKELLAPVPSWPKAATSIS